MNRVAKTSLHLVSLAGHGTLTALLAVTSIYFVLPF